MNDQHMDLCSTLPMKLFRANRFGKLDTNVYKKPIVTLYISKLARKLRNFWSELQREALYKPMNIVTSTFCLKNNSYTTCSAVGNSS